jgi:hypothetical protein
VIARRQRARNAIDMSKKPVQPKHAESWNAAARAVGIIAAPVAKSRSNRRNASHDSVEFEHGLFDRSGNPFFVWQAISKCLPPGRTRSPEPSLPPWCLEYLAKSAKNIVDLGRGKPEFISKAEDAEVSASDALAGMAADDPARIAAEERARAASENTEYLSSQLYERKDGRIVVDLIPNRLGFRGKGISKSFVEQYRNFPFLILLFERYRRDTKKRGLSRPEAIKALLIDAENDAAERPRLGLPPTSGSLAGYPVVSKYNSVHGVKEGLKRAFELFGYTWDSREP